MTQEMIKTETKNFIELGFTVVARAFGYYVQYDIYEIVYCIEGSTKGVADVPMWHKAGSDDSGDVVATLAESEIYASGSVKWDGCSDWKFDEQDRCMLHGCTKDDLLNLGKILAECWDWTTTLCPHWDGR